LVVCLEVVDLVRRLEWGGSGVRGGRV